METNAPEPSESALGFGLPQTKNSNKKAKLSPLFTSTKIINP
jgi:hypothetical protein